MILWSALLKLQATRELQLRMTDGEWEQAKSRDLLGPGRGLLSGERKETMPFLAQCVVCGCWRLALHVLESLRSSAATAPVGGGSLEV